MTQYTRCPHCDTAFVVTEEQLSIANGKVRCGNCKAIFNAREPEPELAVYGAVSGCLNELLMSRIRGNESN